MVRTHEHPACGFVLIAVVMFVLALSILGMSLYAISGYESAFLGQSRDDVQALYSAQGGIDMVCARLALTPWRLDTAHQLEGIEGVERATAYQRRAGGAIDSVGGIDFTSDSLVTVVVSARIDGATRRIQGTFHPNPGVNWYTRLFTISGANVTEPPGAAHGGSIYVRTDLLGLPIRGTVSLGANDVVWQESANTAWVSDVDWSPVTPPVHTGVPVADVASFYAGHTPGALTPQIAGPHVRFNRHTPGTIGYYVAEPGGNPNYSFQGNTVQLEVEGTAIWMLPHGFRAENTVDVSRLGSAPATLVIVGSPFAGRIGPASLDRNVGIWFFTGLDVHDNVNVILVSDGQVNIECNYSVTAQLFAQRLSIFSHGLYVAGPLVSLGYHSWFSHPTDMNATIEYLQANNALPDAVGGTPQHFTFVPGGWRDLTP